MEVVFPEIHPRSFARDANLAFKNERFLPAVFLRGRHVSFLTTNEDLKVERFTARIDDPVFGYPRSMIRKPQQTRILVHGTITENFQHPIRRSLDFTVAITLVAARNQSSLSRFKGLPFNKTTIWIVRYTGGRMSNKNSIGIEHAVFQFLAQIGKNASNLTLDKNVCLGGASLLLSMINSP